MMTHSKLVLAFVATFYLLSNYSSFAQDLNATVCNARLPTARGHIASMYDRDDTIFVFGGYSSLDPPEIQTFKYSISQDTLTPIAEQPPFSSFGGGIVKDKVGNIYYLVGNVYGENNLGEDIFQYFSDTESFTNVTKLHHATHYFGLVQPDNDTALIIGGWGDSNIIQSLNLNSLVSEKIAEIPKTETYLYQTSAIWVEEQRAAFIFDEREGFENVTKFEVSSNRSEIMKNYFPPISGDTEAVYDGKHGYIVGAYGSEIPANTITQFDPNTGDVKFIPVHGHPGISDYSRFHGTSAVYVEKLNRIYTFGGVAKYWNEMYFDDITYISLDPISSPELAT